MADDPIQLKRLPTSELDDRADLHDRTMLLSGDQHHGNNADRYDNVSKIDRRLTIDEIAESLKCGLFQYLCFFVCGLCFTAEGLIVQSVSIIVVSACDLNITTGNRTWLGMSMLIGTAVSSFFFGISGDFFGRRRILLVALSINIIFTFASAFANNYVTLVVLSFFNGVGCGGVLPVTLAYAVEFFPRKYRGMTASASNGYWCFGNMYAALMALWIIPQSFNISVGNITLVSWRIFTMVCVIPPIMAWISLVFMPNSPRFLIKQGKPDKTLQVLHKIHHINKRCYRNGTYEDPLIELSNLPTKEELDNETSDDCGKRGNLLCSPLYGMLGQYAKLYSARWRKQTMLICTIWFLYSFCTYGLWLWIPTLYSLYSHGQTCGQFHNFINSSHNIAVQSMNHSSSCATRSHDVTIYRNLFINTIATLVIEAIFIPTINYLGRRLLFSGLTFLSSLSIFAIWLTNTSTGIMICACFFSGFSGSGWNILNIWSSELYPTHLRSTSNGWVNLWGRTGGIVGTVAVGQLLRFGCSLPIIIVAVAGFITCALSLTLPDTTKAEIK